MDREVELREFVSARGAALSRAAYLLTGDHQAAEDLVQDTYVTLVRRWQKAGKVDPEAYVRRILYSRFVDTGGGGGCWSCRGPHPLTPQAATKRARPPIGSRFKRR